MRAVERKSLQGYLLITTNPPQRSDLVACQTVDIIGVGSRILIIRRGIIRAIALFEITKMNE